MLHKLLTMVVPMALPFLAWAAYVWAARWKAARRASGEPLPGWARPPWGWLLVSGGLLVLVALVAVRLLGDGTLSS